jgi:predicted nucleic acid-binding protein
MVTAVDSSVLIAIDKREPTSSEWLALLQHAREVSRLVVCDVVVAEVSSLFGNSRDFIAFLRDLQIHFDPIMPEAAIKAGHLFRDYRRAGGPRLHLIPDFLIGAHALHQTDQLAAADRGYLRRHFPRLKVVSPH